MALAAAVPRTIADRQTGVERVGPCGLEEARDIGDEVRHAKAKRAIRTRCANGDSLGHIVWIGIVSVM
jgi:hypothetical protein